MPSVFRALMQTTFRGAPTWYFLSISEVRPRCIVVVRATLSTWVNLQGPRPWTMSFSTQHKKRSSQAQSGLSLHRRHLRKSIGEGIHTNFESFPS